MPSFPSDHPDRPPQYGTERRADRPTFGRVDAQVARLLGWSLFPWQDYVADTAGEYDPRTRLPFYRTVGVGVSRQNGKTTLICARIARQLIPPRQTAAYTAQDRTVARTKWAEHVDLLMSTPFADRVERVDLANHREMLVMKNGSRYIPVTPAGKKAARSMTVDLAVIDEAHAHESMAVIGALQPTMAARPAAQIWLLSNAGDSTSLLWRHYTDLGRAEVNSPTSTMCWFEWAAESAADIHDPSGWADGNPSLGHKGGVTVAALADSALTMDPDTFRREHLNIWTETSSLYGIDPVTWAANVSDELVGTRVAIGLDFTPERDRGSLVAASINGDGSTPLEVLEATRDLEHLVLRAASVANQWNCPIIIDRGAPAASAIPALERATKHGRKDGDHWVRAIPLTDFVRACGDFHDAAVHAKLSHRGDFRLGDAVGAATKRRVGDAWAWERRGSKDISPLVAATLARWGIINEPEPAPPPVATIHRPTRQRLRAGNSLTAARIAR